MKLTHTRGLLALLATAALAASAMAGEPRHEQHLIKIKTGDAELFEADLKDLAIGESRSFVTGGGKTVDLIRVQDGVEVYVDGVLLDLGDAQVHGAHVVHKNVEVTCDGDSADDCTHDVMFIGEGDVADGDVKVIRKHVEIVCEDGEDCESFEWDSAGGEFDVEVLHEAGDHEKVIVIQKQSETYSED